MGLGRERVSLVLTASPPMPRIRAGLRRELVALHHGRVGRRRSSSLGRYTIIRAGIQNIFAALMPSVGIIVLKT